MSAVELAGPRAVLAELKELHADGWCACRSATLPARIEAALDALITAAETAPDWRVLGGLVPGVINAEWLRDGDRVRLNELDGTVHLHTVDRRDDVARFVFVTDTGQVRVERSLDSEVLVLAPAAGVDR